MFRPKTRYVALPSPRAGVGEEIDRLKCPKCDTSLEPARLTTSLGVCYRCGYHFRLRAPERIAMLVEPGSFHEEDQQITATDALGRLGAAGIPYVSLLTDPTMGGVTASFASLADVILAEPGAMIGFAGARVIQQATYETLPEGFQTAEFLWQHGMIDLVVPRPELPAVLRQLLDLYVKNGVAEDFELQPQANASAPTPAVRG